MTVNEVMTRNPKTCRLWDSIETCARIMADNNLGFLPVVDEDGTLVGAITDRDIAIRGAAQGKSLNTRIEEIYSDKPVHLEEGDTLGQAEDLMMKAHIRRLVIIDKEKKPIGVVSACDVGRHEQDSDRLCELFRTILQPMKEGRTVESLVGSSCCG